MNGRSAKELLGEVASLGRIQQRLESMTDRQVGQKVWTDVLNELPMDSHTWGIAAEAAERLFRSQGGVRGEHEEFNDIENLPVCPMCRGNMFHHVGIAEPDYRKCESCGYKVQETPEEQR